MATTPFDDSNPAATPGRRPDAAMPDASVGQPPAAESVDIHCHCLPSVDDGPSDLVAAIDLCNGLVADGFSTVIATPHQLGRYHGKNEAAAVRKAVAALNRSLMSENVHLNVLPGGDVRIDERIPRLLADDQILTLGDKGVYLLLELPHDTFLDPLALLRTLVKGGIRPILSHPERNKFLTSRPAIIEDWLRAGTVLQLTAASFKGEFGSTAQRAAWYWLETGKAALVATDAHGTDNRPPRMRDASRLISARLGGETARRVCVDNPYLVLQGAELLPAVRRTNTVVL